MKSIFPRSKVCKVCKGKFSPMRPLQICCSPDCAISYGQRIALKARKQDTRARLEKLKTRSQWLREAQAIFNKYIRARDEGCGCISCGRDSGAKMNAGHYLSVGAHPELRFNELQTNSQCEHCNSYLSGNQIEYRKRLIKKIGLATVEAIEEYHAPAKYTVEDLKRIKQEYIDKLKKLQETSMQ